MRASCLPRVLTAALVLTLVAALPANAEAAFPAAASPATFSVRSVCPPAGVGHLHCDALELIPRLGSLQATATCRPPLASEGCYGLRPEDLHTAYGLPAEAPTAQKIAIVSAGDDHTAASDLAVYDSEFGLPACTRKNHCLTVLNGEGRRKPLPPSSAEAATETSIDLQVAQGVCPNCSLLLVEARSNTLAAFEEAEEAAARVPGVTEISNSWGEIEPASPARAGKAFDHPGIVITASAGDTGYDNWGSEEAQRGGAEYPASSPDVIAVGGTKLALSETGQWLSESPWEAQAGAGGSGCSRYFTAPSWQLSLRNWDAVGCGSMRAVSDLAVVGDPYTGVAIYDSTKSGKVAPQWKRLGGTSVGAPLVAAAFALAGGANGVAYPAQTIYADAPRIPGVLHDIASGSNGECSQIAGECSTEEESADCKSVAICVAGPGYDGPTGLGSLDGIAALTPLPPLRTQQIDFTSTPPKEATVAGPAYALSATASSGLTVSLDSQTPTVCLLSAGSVSFLAPGRCSLTAEQAGNGEYEAAPNLTQTFSVASSLTAPGAMGGTLSFMSSSPPSPDSRFTLFASRRPGRGAAVALTASVAQAGVLTWTLTFLNGSFGVIEGGVRACGAHTVHLAGGCRAARAVFGTGHAKIAAGRIELNVRPLRLGALVLSRARRKGRKLNLVVLVSFRSALGGPAVTHTLKLALEPSAS